MATGLPSTRVLKSRMLAGSSRLGMAVSWNPKSSPPMSGIGKATRVVTGVAEVLTNT